MLFSLNLLVIGSYIISSGFQTGTVSSSDSFEPICRLSSNIFAVSHYVMYLICFEMSIIMAASVYRIKLICDFMYHWRKATFAVEFLMYYGISGIFMLYFNQKPVEINGWFCFFQLDPPVTFAYSLALFIPSIFSSAISVLAGSKLILKFAETVENMDSKMVHIEVALRMLSMGVLIIIAGSFALADYIAHQSKHLAYLEGVPVAYNVFLGLCGVYGLIIFGSSPEFAEYIPFLKRILATINRVFRVSSALSRITSKAKTTASASVKIASNENELSNDNL
jgi:hypothetical protein